jgi:hypothetical protein
MDRAQADATRAALAPIVEAARQVALRARWDALGGELTGDAYIVANAYADGAQAAADAVRVAAFNATLAVASGTPRRTPRLTGELPTADAPPP